MFLVMFGHYRMVQNFDKILTNCISLTCNMQTAIRKKTLNGKIDELQKVCLIHQYLPSFLRSTEPHQGAKLHKYNNVLNSTVI